MTDLEFIQGKRNEKILFIHDLNKNIGELSVKIIKNGVEREYTPIHFLNLVLEAHYIAIDKTTSPSERITIIYDAKREVIHYIEEFRNVTPVDVRSQLDFSGIISQVDVTIDKIRLELDINKHNLEVQKLHKENKFFTTPIIFSGIALIISIATPIITYLLPDKPEKYRIMQIQEMHAPKLDATKNEYSDTKSISSNMPDSQYKRK